MGICFTDQITLDTPYNTYVISGLPVGPICNPSPAALEAALHPNQTFIDEGYLYFCSKDPNSGELYFSKTRQEHEAAVAEYRPLWESFDEEQRAFISSYAPQQVTKLDHAEVRVIGRYVIYTILSPEDTRSAFDTVEQMLKK